MALIFTDWNNYTDGGTAKTLDWTSAATVQGNLPYPYIEAIRQAIVERTSITRIAIDATLEDEITRETCINKILLNKIEQAILDLINGVYSFVNQNRAGEFININQTLPLEIAPYTPTDAFPVKWTEAEIYADVNLGSKYSSGALLSIWIKQRQEVLKRLVWFLGYSCGFNNISSQYYWEVFTSTVKGYTGEYSYVQRVSSNNYFGAMRNYLGYENGNDWGQQIVSTGNKNGSWGVYLDLPSDTKIQSYLDQLSAIYPKIVANVTLLGKTAKYENSGAYQGQDYFTTENKVYYFGPIGGIGLLNYNTYVLKLDKSYSTALRNGLSLTGVYKGGFDTFNLFRRPPVNTNWKVGHSDRRSLYKFNVPGGFIFQ